MTNARERTLSVLSLNCWGLNIVAKQRKFRLNAIADCISQQDYDIVALQEVWMWEDFDYIKFKTQANLPFSKYFHSGTLGSGLVLMSRFPILSSAYLKFTLAGKPLKIFQGDYYVGKGCGSVCIDHPHIGLVDVFTTHLQAGYGNHDEYEAQRITECWQIANAVRASAAQGRHVILAGDFNSIPTSLCYQILKSHGFMTDSWLETHADTMEDTIDRYEKNQLDASDCIQLFGITCDSPLDTWSQHYLKQEPYAKDIGDRLDYIFYRRTPQMVCQQSKVVMEQYIPQTQMSYSDHFAVHSVFSITTEANGKLTNEFDAPLASQLARPDYSLLNAETLDAMIAVMQLDLGKATTTANNLLFLCGISVLMVFGMYVLQVLLPFYYNYSEVAILVSTIFFGLLLIVFSMLAVVCLVVGFVFGRMEQRSLRQYLIDITLCADILGEHKHAPQVPTTIHSKSNSHFKDGSSSLSCSSLIKKDNTK